MAQSYATKKTKLSFQVQISQSFRHVLDLQISQIPLYRLSLKTQDIQKGKFKHFQNKD